MKCIFCEIVKGASPARKIWENDRFIAFFPLEHINPGHTLLVPKVHIDYIFDLNAKDYSDLWEAVRSLSSPLKRATKSKRIAIAVEGFGVAHVHVHLVPVYKGNELDPNRAKRLSDETSDQLLKKIVRQLENSTL